MLNYMFNKTHLHYFQTIQCGNFCTTNITFHVIIQHSEALHQRFSSPHNSTLPSSDIGGTEPSGSIIVKLEESG